MRSEGERGAKVSGSAPESKGASAFLPERDSRLCCFDLFPSLWEGLGEGAKLEPHKPSPQPSPKGRGRKSSNLKLVYPRIFSTIA